VIGSLQNVGFDTFTGVSSYPGEPPSFGGLFIGASVVPEPATALHMLVGIAGLGYASYRNHR
jgi:hypothetical protein